MAHELPEFTDRANCGGASATITIAAGATVEAKVGASALSGREFIEWEALDSGLKWGLTNSAAGTTGDSFKLQTFTRPYGENTKVYLRNTKGTPIDVFVAEAN